MPAPITIAALGALGLGGVIYVGMRRWALGFLRTRGRTSSRSPSELALEARAFELHGPDGTLRGWFVPGTPGPAPTVVVAHGWHSHSGDMLAWAEPIIAAGCHAVLYDALGHGESDRIEYTSLHHLREDLRAVLQWARSEPEAEPGLILFGHSMGGAAAVLAADDAPEVRGVIIAGAPTDPLEITREWLEARRLPGGLLVGAMRHVWQSVIRAPYAMLRPVDRIRHLRMPILILHGDSDRHVGTHHAERLAAANPGAELHIIPGGDHYSLPKWERYAATVMAFIARAISAG